MKIREYSGAFFWLATASFVMPLAVAVWAFTQLPLPYTYPEIEVDPSGVDQNLWNHLLRNYVADGLVDYHGFKRDHHFQTYLTQIAGADPDKLNRDEKLAFYCNAYNAFVIDGVIRHGIPSNVLDFKTEAGMGFFDAKEHVLANQTLDLNTLEHKIIRPTFNDPRIHMALVCAAKSCPQIRGEAYFGNRIDQQLEDQARLFVNSKTYVRFEPTDKTLYLSPILDWYGDDFGGRPGYLDFLRVRCADETLQRVLQEARDGSYQIEFNKYDWSLNAQDKPAGHSGRGGGPALGSGSVHNDEI